MKIKRFIVKTRKTPENIGGLFTVNFVTGEKEYFEVYVLDRLTRKERKLNLLEQLKVLGL